MITPGLWNKRVWVQTSTLHDLGKSPHSLGFLVSEMGIKLGLGRLASLRLNLLV